MGVDTLGIDRVRVDISGGRGNLNEKNGYVTVNISAVIAKMGMPGF